MADTPGRDASNSATDDALTDNSPTTSGPGSDSEARDCVGGIEPTRYVFDETDDHCSWRLDELGALGAETLEDLEELRGELDARYVQLEADGKRHTAEWRQVFDQRDRIASELGACLDWRCSDVADAFETFVADGDELLGELGAKIGSCLIVDWQGSEVTRRFATEFQELSGTVDRRNRISRAELDWNGRRLEYSTNNGTLTAHPIDDGLAELVREFVGDLDEDASEAVLVLQAHRELRDLVQRLCEDAWDADETIRLSALVEIASLALAA